ncbi:MAG: c-type cytochrome [Isosphaeraceae bacterium]|nr:c-type cytochrome [Isosphaeraceae bacterium]
MRPTFTFPKATLVALSSLVGLAGAGKAFGQDRPRFYTEKPTPAASETKVGPSAAAVLPDAAHASLLPGPAPSWIWGADADTAYVLRKEIPAGFTSARVWATADNEMKLFFNGKEIAASDSWQEPVIVDLAGPFPDGRSEIRAEVRNAGGIAGFACKILLVTEGGRNRFVVSDRSWRAEKAGDAKAKAAPVKVVGKLGDAPWDDLLAKGAGGFSAKRGVFQTLPGYRVEKLFTVPRDQLGSWVSITFDPQGRLIASDQEKLGLSRITIPRIGTDEVTKVERLDVGITSAQGMLHAFGALYLSVNGGPGSGLYRARDTNGDDQYDKVEKLAVFHGGGEHGPHALRLSPDGKSIYVVCGNHTDPPTKIDSSLVPTNWSEDHLLPRQWDANGHARGRMAPGGWIAKTDPDGKTWEVVSVGYRNSYDFDFNAEGEIFAYDSDMEWDFGMPWYRPTRVNHAVSGSEFGWRSGTGKWPAYYVDSLPPAVDIGPGSPVGVAFGRGAKFPAKYQKALFILDWTFGTIYAIHLEPLGSTFKGIKEEFVSRSPLPLTDTAVGPDGALYFTVGGRGTQSELYRVIYEGTESTAPAEPTIAENAELRRLRRSAEKYHRLTDDPEAAVAAVWPLLSHEDRFIRYAARVALEHQPVATWKDRVTAERNPEALVTAAVGLARQGEPSARGALLAALGRVDYAKASETLRLELLRAYQLVFIRMGMPDKAVADALAKKLDGFYPAANDYETRELCNLLVYLGSPTVAAKTIALLAKDNERKGDESAELLTRNAGYGGTIAQVMANRPDGQNIALAFSLRNLKQGWTLEERKAYFRFLQKARGWSGGASYQGFINNIDKDAFENCSEAERLAVEATGARKPYKAVQLPAPIGPGKEWSLEELLELSQTKMTKRNFENGKRAFAAARCVACHRFGGDGGATGPDLTQAAGRFAFKDLAEAVIDPSKVVSDQYKATVIATTGGQVHTGRIVSENDKSVTILVDPEDSTKVVEVARTDIDEKKPLDTSLMPKGLFNTLNENEVLDMLAYILSRGDQNDPAFRGGR